MKSQLMGQVFIYILAAIVFGGILLFGYKAVLHLQENASQVALVDLKQNIQEAINSVASSPDVQKRTIYIPSAYRILCFLGDADISAKMQTCLCNDDVSCIGVQDDYNPLLCDAWVSGTKQNVFLVPLADIEIFVSNILLDDNYLCIPNVKGSVVLRLEGKGASTLVRAW